MCRSSSAWACRRPSRNPGIESPRARAVEKTWYPASPRHDERQEVAGHALSRGLEQQGEAEQHVALGDGEAGPIVDVPPQVEAPRVPGTEPLRVVVQAHRDGVVTQRARSGRPRLPEDGGMGGTGGAGGAIGGGTAPEGR